MFTPQSASFSTYVAQTTLFQKYMMHRLMHVKNPYFDKERGVPRVGDNNDDDDDERRAMYTIMTTTTINARWTHDPFGRTHTIATLVRNFMAFHTHPNGMREWMLCTLHASSGARMKVSCL